MKRFSEKRVTLINLRLISQKRRKLGMRYGLPTFFRRVELAFVQQTKEQTYKFTGSQRECSFMLMVSCFSIFLVIECFVFRTVSYNTSGSFYDVVAQISVASFAHVFVFGYEVARVIIVPNDTTVFCEGIDIRKSLNGTHFG